MRQATRSSGARTKRAAVEEGLRLLIRTRDQRAIRRLRGKVAWEGDLEESRLGLLKPHRGNIVSAGRLAQCVTGEEARQDGTGFVVGKAERI